MSHTNGYLDKATILGQTKLPTKEIDVPEWGGKVLIRVMSAGERDRYETRQRADVFENIRARTAVYSLCDADGNLLFSENDMPALSALHGKALDRIFEAAIPFNKIGKGDIDELKKNSETIRPDDSSSSSPGTSA